MEFTLRVTGIETIVLKADQRSNRDRRKEWQNRSFAWADSLHGQKVVIANRKWVDSIGHEGVTLEGIAHRISNAAGGWGQVQVTLDDQITPEKEWAEKEAVKHQHQTQLGEKIVRYKGFYLYHDKDMGHWTDIISYGDRRLIQLK